MARNKATVESMRLEWAENDAKRDAGLIAPDNIEQRNDIAYGENNPWNLLDVYYLKGTVRPLPCIISIHGGGWFYGDKELYSHYCMRLAQRGFAVVNFNYRLAPEYKYPSPLEDICAVFRWVLEHGSEYFIDTNNIFMVGDSAGAQLNLQICDILTNPEYRALFAFDVPDIKINAVALNCGVYMLPFGHIIKPTGVMGAYFPDNYTDMLPQFKLLKNVTANFPPSFVMGAINDPLTFMAKPLYRTLKKHGVDSVMKVYGTKEQKEVSHVFHVNCKLDIAALCNDEQCAFFRAHMR